MTIQIGGLNSFTTIDYPGKLAAVLFLKGCPVRCVYCSNPHLIEVGVGEYDPDKVIEWLQDRTGKLDAVVFSGGEALMQGDATIDYMRRVKKLGFLIGLHTNGFYPEVLSRAIDVIDWIGLDFKTTKNNYISLAGVKIAYERMMQSLDVWFSAGKDGEVRVTCDPRFVTKKELIEIATIVSERGVKKFAVQRYIPHFEDEANPTTETMRNQFFNDLNLKDKINHMFDQVFWRE